MFLRILSLRLNLCLTLGIVAYLFGPGDAQRMMCSSGPCGPGQLLDSDYHCVSCPPGTYLPEWQHSCRSCRPCSTPIEHNHEIILRNCTSVTDTDIACGPGHFRKLYGPGEQDCLKCSICQIGSIISECGMFSDAVCAKAKTPDNQPMIAGEPLELKIPPRYIIALVVVFGALLFVFISYLRFCESVSMSYTLARS